MSWLWLWIFINVHRTFRSCKWQELYMVVEELSAAHEGHCSLSFITFRRQCFKMFQMFSQYCHSLISLENAMQGSNWNLSLDIRSHCGLGTWVNFIRKFTYLNVCILSSICTLLVTRHWRMGPQTPSQCAVPVLWRDEQGDTRLHSDKNSEIDSVTGTIVYMEQNY